MRAPHHLEVKANCRNLIDKIWSKWKLGEVEKIEFDDQGWVNVTAFVNDDLVIRFNARDIHLPKFQREVAIINLLKNVIQVPELIVFDDSKEIIEYDYTICKKIKGKNLEQSWSSLTVEDGSVLAFQAGELLAKLHSRTYDYFGEIAELSPFPRTNSWSKYLRFVLNYHLSHAMELELFKPAVKKQFLNLFESNLHRLDSVVSAKLLHGDFHLGNLLFSGGNITGVLDFEWSFYGDPLFDISNNLRDMDSRWPGSQDAFNKGYGIKGFSDDEIEKMKIYAMIKSIELCVVAKKFFTEEESKEYVLTTVSHYA